MIAVCDRDIYTCNEVQNIFANHDFGLQFWHIERLLKTQKKSVPATISHKRKFVHRL